MGDMGRHNAILNGHRGEDGATAFPVVAPPVLQVRQLGPVSGWPAPQNPTVTGDVAEAAAPATRVRYGGVDADTVILILAAAAVLAVAAFAAVVSYSHFFELGRLHHQDGVAARLSPLSADGLIAAASLVMLNAARHKLPVPTLARWMLATGVCVTVAANVIFGLPATWISPVVSALIGAAISAWPAYRVHRLRRDGRAVRPRHAPGGDSGGAGCRCGRRRGGRHRQRQEGRSRCRQNRHLSSSSAATPSPLLLAVRLHGKPARAATKRATSSSAIRGWTRRRWRSARACRCVP